MTSQEQGGLRELFRSARVARLATIRPDGRPHLVPIVFAVADDMIYTAVDGKPKSTTALQRLANIGADAHVSVLADHYDEDWTELWWVRADGTASVTADPRLIDLLAVRYPQYHRSRPPGPVIAIRVDRWTGWRYVAPG